MDLKDFKCIHSRRNFLAASANGLGIVALWHLLALEGRPAAPAESPAFNPLAPRSPHYPPEAKNVIYLFMVGGPSQIDLFDPKPEMKRWEGQSLPESMTKDLLLAFTKPTARIWPSPRSFKPYGQSGIEFSDLMPHTAPCADDICLIRSVYTEQF